MIILTTVLLFASNKLAHLVGRNNPLMSQWHVDILDQKLNMNQERFRFAISIEDFQPPRKQKNSKSYVQWVFRLWSKSKEHGVESRDLEHRVCDDEDYAQFYQIEQTQESLLSEIRKDPDRGFYCIDWNDDDPYQIYGSEV